MLHCSCIKLFLIRGALKNLLSGAGYILVDTPNAFNCHSITTSSECEAAAQSLGLPDTSATPSPISRHDSWGDPPYCYIENGILKFNADGSNTGKCGVAYNDEQQYHDKCLCKSSSTPTCAIHKDKFIPGGIPLNHGRTTKKNSVQDCMTYCLEDYPTAKYFQYNTEDHSWRGRFQNA